MNRRLAATATVAAALVAVAFAPTAMAERGGRHIQHREPTPLANLHLTLLDKVGVRLDAFADSSGKMDELFQPLSL